MLSDKPTKIEREYVLKVFGGSDLFVLAHKKALDRKNVWAEA